MEKRLFRELQELLNKDWSFYSIGDNEEQSLKVTIDSSVVSDSSYDFLGIMEDFYFTEAVRKTSSKGEISESTINSLKKVSDYHSHLLQLKYFYITQMKECLDYLEQEDIDFDR